MPSPAISCTGLTKRYGKARGIEDVTFEVKRGETFGFLGPNGAGKTTTIRLLLDLLRPDAGHAEMLGVAVGERSHAMHARIGYVGTELGLAPRTRVRDHLRFFVEARGAKWDDAEALARRLDLDLSKPFRALSHGNKQKVGLVQAFVHKPELLLLDEPTSGLDPLVQKEFNALVRESVHDGATVFLSSHVLSEVEALCERVAIIREGRLARVDPVAALRAKAKRHVVATYRGEPPDVSGIAGVDRVQVVDHRLECLVHGESGPLVRALARSDLSDLTLHEPTLEELFEGLYAGEDP